LPTVSLRINAASGTSESASIPYSEEQQNHLNQFNQPELTTNAASNLGLPVRPLTKNEVNSNATDKTLEIKQFETKEKDPTKFLSSPVQNIILEYLDDTQGKQSYHYQPELSLFVNRKAQVAEQVAYYTLCGDADTAERLAKENPYLLVVYRSTFSILSVLIILHWIVESLIFSRLKIYLIPLKI